MYRWALAALAASAASLVAGGAEAEAARPKPKPSFSVKELWQLERHFWDQFLYPRNLQQINATDKSVFAPDVRGRVDITRIFDGRELNNEYIFGLFSNPASLSISGVPVAYDITQFAANENVASATTVVTINVTSFDTFLPLTIDTWIAFGPDRRITQYDATFRWFDFYVDAIVAAAAKKLRITDPAAVQPTLAKALAEDICKTSETYCTTGSREHYSSRADCMDFLLKGIRFGRPFELGMNTLLCREVHKHMVGYRPDEHCSHIAKSGGAYCVDDQTYVGVVTARHFLQSWVPYGLADNNSWVATK